LVRNSETGITEKKIKGLLQARKGILSWLEDEKD
jgi:hypothetical protein